MAGTTAIVLASLAIATTAASAGLSYYGQQQQAAQAEAMGRYNYQLQMQQMQMQAKMQEQAALAQAEAGRQNALTYEREAQRKDMEAKERARRLREANERMLGTQKAKIGASGATFEGSPLMVAAKSAGDLEYGVATMLYEADVERSSLYRKAEVERWQAGYAMLDAHAAQYNAATARFRAQPILLESQNTASALRLGSYGSLLDGASSSFAIGLGARGYKAS